MAEHKGFRPRKGNYVFIYYIARQINDEEVFYGFPSPKGELCFYILSPQSLCSCGSNERFAAQTEKYSDLRKNPCENRRKAA